MAELDPSPPHLDARTISGYLDGRLVAPEKERVQAHLAECPRCREDMVELVELMDLHRRWRRRWPIAAVGVAAAAAGVLLLGMPLVRQQAEDPGAIRAPEAAAERESVRSVSVVSPPPDRPLSLDELVFEWQTMGEDAAYRLTVTDEAGSTVWRLETEDTRVAVPSDLELQPGGIYLWYVDALLPDGTTATTGVRRLELAR